MPVPTSGFPSTHAEMPMTWLLIGSALLWWAAGTFASARGDDKTGTALIVAQIRQALGGDALQRHTGPFELQGTAEHNGLKGRYRLTFTPQGLFHRVIENRLHDAVCYDGSTAWGLDWSGTPRVLELEDLEVQQAVHWVQTGRWLAHDGPFEIGLVVDQSDETQVCLRIRLRGGILQARLFVERLTWLPTLLQRQWLGGEETWRFDNYQPSDGFVLARTVVHQRGGLTDSYQVQTVREVSSSSRHSFGPLTSLRADTRFDPSVSPVVELKQSATGHLFVHPKIDGADVGWFALDTGTGAGMTVAPAAARALGMESFGQTISIGAGKTVVTTFRQGKTFELGPMSLTGGVYVELPAQFVQMLQKVMGIEIAGTCGYDLFSRAVVELDQEGKTIELRDPADYRLAAGRWEELRLSHKIPCVRCRFNGDHEGLFHLDTGAATGAARMVALHAPVVESLRLLEGRKLTPIQVGGVGGTVDARLGTLDQFIVGGKRFDQMTALFMLSAPGALSDPYTTGTFGGVILSPFRVVFDYSHRRIAFIEKKARGS